MLSLPRYSRSSTKLNRSKGAGRPRWVIQQLRHGDPNGDHSHGVRIGFIKHSSEALDSFCCCQGTILGVDRLPYKEDRKEKKKKLQNPLKARKRPGENLGLYPGSKAVTPLCRTYTLSPLK